ncbi:MAG: IPT/TIG domain-containing protein [Acidobacteriota bacterium]
MFNRVQPGDLITAEQWNQVLDLLENLDLRVQDIEDSGSQALAITGLLPPQGPYRIGDPLTVLGRNFEHSLGAARVFLDGVRVTLDGLASDDRRLVFQIPPVPGVSEPGTAVTLRVNNQSEQVSEDIILRPAAPVLFGDFDVEFLGVTPQTLVPDQPANFRFRLRNRASSTAEILIDPRIVNVPNADVWQQRLRVLDGNQTPLPERRITLSPLDPNNPNPNPPAETEFFVRLVAVPTVPVGTDFQLVVDASAGAVQGSSGAQPFTVGEATIPQDETITLTLNGSTPPNALSGSTVTAATGSTVRVRFNATFAEAGFYDFSLQPVAPTTGWQIQRFFTTPATYEITDNDVAGGPAARPPEITLQPLGGASPSGRVEVILQRQGRSSRRLFPLDLVLGT